MALSDVEVVRRSLDAFERCGFPDVEELIEWLAEDVELRSAIVGGAEGNTYRGHDGVRQWARAVDEAFDELHMVAEDIRQVGGVVVGLGHVNVRGGASGLTLDVPVAWVLTVRDGKLATMHGYLDHGEAMEAAGASK